MKSNQPMLRLAIIATVVALIATVIVAYTVVDMSREAAAAQYVFGPMLTFSSACFLLTWPAVFLAGLLIARRGGPRGTT